MALRSAQPPSTRPAPAPDDVPAGRVVAENFDGWGEDLVGEFKDNAYNFAVGGTLLSETDEVKVWDIRLKPGERLEAHRHVLNYFWTAVTPGSSRQHTDDGKTREVTYTAGMTRHFAFADGQYLLHDLHNIGDTDLVFVTVEHKTRPHQIRSQQSAVQG